MGKTKSTDEQIIAALLQHGTITEAASACGITPRTIYDRMDNREFRAQYMEAKNDIIRKAVYSINQKLSDAIDSTAEIMTDKGINPAVRLQAAQVIITNAAKFAERLNDAEKASRRTANPPDPFAFDIGIEE